MTDPFCESLQTALAGIQADHRYLANVTFRGPRPCQPVTALAQHISELEANLEVVKEFLGGHPAGRPLTEGEDLLLRIIIHSHDTLRANAKDGVPLEHEGSHASLARRFVSEFHHDRDLLLMVQLHNEPYALYLEFRQNGGLNKERLERLIRDVLDWDTFLTFQLIDSSIPGASPEPVRWFLQQVVGKVSVSLPVIDMFAALQQERRQQEQGVQLLEQALSLDLSKIEIGGSPGVRRLFGLEVHSRRNCIEWLRDAAPGLLLAEPGAEPWSDDIREFIRILAERLAEGEENSNAWKAAAAAIVSMALPTQKETAHGTSKVEPQSPHEMYEALSAIVNDPRYQRNLNCGEPRPGHPEATVAGHICELERNLQLVESLLESMAGGRALTGKEKLSLQILVHTHDTFKAEARHGVPIQHPDSHASLARKFAADFMDDEHFLEMLQRHDEPHALHTRAQKRGEVDRERLAALLEAIKDWDAFLLFQIIDNTTLGKSSDSTAWFLDVVAGRVPTSLPHQEIYAELKQSVEMEMAGETTATAVKHRQRRPEDFLGKGSLVAHVETRHVFIAWVRNELPQLLACSPAPTKLKDEEERFLNSLVTDLEESRPTDNSWYDLASALGSALDNGQIVPRPE